MMVMKILSDLKINYLINNLLIFINKVYINIYKF